MIVIIAQNDNVSEDIHTAKDNAVIDYSDEQADEVLETVEKLVKDPETEIVVVRRRSKLNEKLKDVRKSLPDFLKDRLLPL